MSRAGLVAPAYLGACLLLGGSALSSVAVGVLQLLGLGLMVWALWRRPAEPLSPAARQLGWLVALLAGLFVVQLVPLPPAVWTLLPGRAPIAAGFALLGGPLPWQSISLAPYDTIASALTLVPPLAMLALIVVKRACHPAALALVVLIATAAGVMLGVLQLSSPDPQHSPYYIQSFANFGAATGFFANQNHMATLLVCALPLLAALVAGRGGAGEASTSDRQRRQGAASLVPAAAMAGVVLVGILLNRSLAGYGLAIPSLILSLLLIVRLPARAELAMAGVALLGMVGFIMLLASPLRASLFDGDAVGSIATRQQIGASSLAAAAAVAPVGSGIGTFQALYPRFESRPVEQTYINHAHDDYLEVAVEAGLPGLALILLFLGWWGASVVAMLRTPAADAMARAGAITSGLVLAHSLVDFPLRTSAIAALFAASLGLMLVSRTSARRERDWREARHLELG